MLMRMILLVLFCAVALPGRAIVNGTAPAEDDTRFDAVGGWGETRKLNHGHGHRATDQWYGAAVLIAPDVVLTAKHLLPRRIEGLPDPGVMTVRFRRREDGSLGSKREGPASYHQVTIERFIPCPNADLMLCVLSEPVEHIEPVRVDLTGEGFERRRIVLAGWGSESHWQGVGGPRRGLTVGEHTASVRGQSVALASFETEPRENPEGERAAYIIDPNAVPNLYDSGGSMFIEEDGDLFLVGIIATYSAGTWVGQYVDDEAFPVRAACQGADALLEALGDEE